MQVEEIERQLQQSTQERGAACGSGVPRIREPRGHAAEGRGRDQGGVRPAERAQFRIPVPEAGSRRRQVALRGTGAQDQRGRHQRRIPEQFHPHRRPGARRHQAGVSEHEAERAAGVPVFHSAGGGVRGPDATCWTAPCAIPSRCTRFFRPR